MENRDQNRVIEDPTRFTSAPSAPMEEGAMRFLFELGKNVNDFILTEIDGQNYTNSSNLRRVPKYERPDPVCFPIQTVTGLVDWLKADVEKIFEKWGTVFVVVSGVSTVQVMSPFHGEGNERASLAKCTIEMPKIRLNEYLSQEDFIVMLQTHFCEGDNRDAVALVAGNIRMQEEASTADDGMSQRVTVKGGTASLHETIIKNPVMLAPRRTFPEVLQPASPFVLRIKGEKDAAPTIALFEADGGAWKIDAIRTIGEWLEDQLVGLNVSIIA